jgi:phosphate transport system permease protein
LSASQWAHAAPAIGARLDGGGPSGKLFRKPLPRRAALVLLTLGGIIVTLFIGGLPPSAFRIGLPDLHALGPGRGARGIRRTHLGLRHGGHLGAGDHLAVPVAFGIAFFLTELAPQWLRRPVGTAIELLAAIPPSSTACGAFSCWCPSCR